ncbi:hypothetical protein JQ631_32135 [Bradyrhizobium manausense]|uniref:hypothetical protein n=1 Tax=Bradyrhizobium manausense TaxID=989370 RepID=UPI001BAC715F|nr:hypothetical protein [Bradyrhizobium manausense]MBR0793755.1 hypothetical protein [Bradyrhizobium manausense]
MKLWTYRLARGAGHSRWHAFRAAFFNAELPDPTKEFHAAMDASRVRLWKSGDENIKRIILSDLVAQLDRLAVNGDGDYAVELEYLEKIRRMDPELAEQVRLQHSAAMHDHLARHDLD